MTSRNAAEIALGVAGVWLIVSRLPDIAVSLAWSTADGDPDPRLRWLGVVHISLVIACGLSLVRLRRAIASWLVPTPEAGFIDSVTGLQAAAFSVVGLALLADGLSHLLAELAISASGTGEASFYQLSTPIAQIAVGLALFLGTRGVVTIWRSIRTAGLPSGDRDTDAA